MIEVCGVLVHARPERVGDVRGVLASMPGVEVHGVTDEGRMVITLENTDADSRLSEGLADLTDRLLLPEPTPGAEPSWFGFPLTLKTGRAPERPAVIAALEARRIATRMLLAGNMTRQPAFEGVTYRVAGSLENTDRITRDSFWVGVYPGITEEMCAYVAESIREAVEKTAEQAH